MRYRATSPGRPDEVLARIASLRGGAASSPETAGVVAEIEGERFELRLEDAGLPPAPVAHGAVEGADAGAALSIAFGWGPLPGWAPRVLVLLAVFGGLAILAEGGPWPFAVVLPLLGLTFWISHIRGVRRMLQAVSAAVGDLSW